MEHLMKKENIIKALQTGHTFIQFNEDSDYYSHSCENISCNACCFFNFSTQDCTVHKQTNVHEETLNQIEQEYPEYFI